MGLPAQASAPQRQPAAPAPQRQAAAPAARPVFRGQAPEQPRRPATVTMPSPEQLGVRAAGAGQAVVPAADSDDTGARLRALGVDCSRLEHQDDGKYCFLILVPTDQPGRSHHVEGRAATQGEAIRLALERAEALRRTAVAAR